MQGDGKIKMFRYQEQLIRDKKSFNNNERMSNMKLSRFSKSTE